MNRKIISCVAALLAALTLWGCTPKASQPTLSTTAPAQTTAPIQQTEPTQSVPGSTETSATVPEISEPAPTQPTETDPPAITEPTRPGEPVTLQPITELSSTRWVTFPELLSMGDGIVMACRNHYVSKQGKFKNTIELIDVYQDKVIRELTVDFTREPVLQLFDDRHILVVDPESCTFYEYDFELKLVNTFTAPASDGWFSHDRQFYYYIIDGLLYRQTLANGNRIRLRLEQDLRLQSLVSIHPTEDLLVARFYLSAYTDDLGLAVIDARTGTFRLVREDWSHLWFTGDRFYALSMSEEGFGYDVYIGDLTGDTLTLLDADTVGIGAVNYAVMPGSHLMIRWIAPDEGDHYTEVYDLAAGTKADLRSYDYDLATYGGTYLFEEDLIMGYYEDGAYFIPILIDPKALTLDTPVAMEQVQRPELVDQSVIDAYLATVDPAFSDALSEVRAEADVLEDKYHITIQIGGQTTLPVLHAGRQAALAQDPDQIHAALAALDEAFACYPDDLFRQFRNRAGEGGICISLTGQIQGDLPTAGYTKLLRDRYVLLLDITAEGLNATFHHELWHLLEMKISADSFENSGWADCNPADFKYYGKYSAGYLDLTRWTWSGGSGADSYFLDPYSRINAREDRARIWEAVLTGQTQPFAGSAYLRAKLQLMVDALTARFASVQWDPSLWGTCL